VKIRGLGFQRVYAGGFIFVLAVIGQKDGLVALEVAEIGGQLQGSVIVHDEEYFLPVSKEQQTSEDLDSEGVMVSHRLVWAFEPQEFRVDNFEEVMHSDVRNH